MASRMTSRSSPVENKNNTQGTPSLSFYQESGQQYRPFINPERIETNDARRNSGQDRRAYVRGVPKEFLGIMDTTATSPVTIEPVVPIVEHPHSEATPEMPEPDDQHLLHLSSDLQFSTSSNLDRRIVMDDLHLPIMEADRSYLRLHIPDLSSEYFISSPGSFDEHTSSSYVIGEEGSCFSSMQHSNSDIEHLYSNTELFANMNSGELPSSENYDVGIHYSDSTSSYSPSSSFSLDSSQPLTPVSAYSEEPQGVLVHGCYEDHSQDMHSSCQVSFDSSVGSSHSHSAICMPYEMHETFDQTPSIPYDRWGNQSINNYNGLYGDSKVQFSVDSNYSPHGPVFSSGGDPNAFLCAEPFQCQSI
ncbi:hypothetical protein EW145_g2262 [Phellinidium pouzarii]|uniref:Uncharacterized protein n=1 Tax=Phellinidium pouzarii TaxID=167371 RepID=A0A4S4LBI8_9AGAM|nr:hypothetical protein EW145_g2262 [Phellinidium pouzarii]